MKQPITLLLLVGLAGFAAAAGKIIYPWNAVTTIVKAGEAFEVWFDAETGEVVNSAELRGPFLSIRIPSVATETGTWTYDPISGSTYDTRVSVSVPAGTPTDRYDLILHTSGGKAESISAVKVVQEYKADYKILHLSDSHLRDGMAHQSGLLEKKHTAIVNMANIINPELVFVTGDNIMFGRNFQDRADNFYLGNDEHGFKGMHDFNAACFVVAGNHDHGAEPYEGHHEEKALFWNQYHGLQHHGFQYGTSRFMLFSNAWVDYDWSWQRAWFDDWLKGDGAGGKLRVAAAHLSAADRMGRFANRNGLDLSLAGHNHHLGDRNPWQLDDRLILFYARAVREYFEFNLYRVNDRTGEWSALGAINTDETSDGHGLPTGICMVLENDELRNDPDVSGWKLNLTLDHARPNDGTSPDNTATLVNRFDFDIPDAHVRFVMPKGTEYAVSEGSVEQAFDGDSVHVVDVSLDLMARTTTTVRIAAKTALHPDPDTSGRSDAPVDRNQGEPAATVLKLMTYNLKYASPSFKPSWEVRRGMQLDMINIYQPDIIGTQEGLKEQVDYLADHLPGYVAVGEGRKGGDDDEHMAIFFRRDKFRLRELQNFQLSETPAVPGSGPEVNPRMVTWGRFAVIHRPGEGEPGPYPQDYRGHWENTEEFYVFNTHFFNSRDQALARLNASKLIMERINALGRFGEWSPERPVFLMGDFNCRPGSAPYKIFVGDDHDPGPFRDADPVGGKIDWILHKGPVKLLRYEEVDYHVDGVYPSDHKPIYAEFEVQKFSNFSH